MPTSDPQSELQVICDALPVLIAQVDAGERYRFSNRAYQDWFGLPASEIGGRAVRDVLGAEDYREMQPHIRAALSGEKRAFNMTHLRRDGSTRAVRVTCVPRVNPIGIVEGVYFLMADDTDRQRSEERARTMNAELEERVRERTVQLESANRELEAFCYSVSHDLRAPLRAVRGFTDILLEQHASQLDERGRDFLHRVGQASAQMDKLVDDLLRLSRVSRTEVQPQQVHLSQMADEILAELKKGDPGREVETVVAPGMTAEADERLVRLVMDNLLRNAWKFTATRKPGRIEFGRLAGEEAAFYVRDNGVGFDMTYASRLFGVFQRLHSATDFPGSGVGLAIVQRVISRHGGRVWAEGRTNEGATFSFTLPAGSHS